MKTRLLLPLALTATLTACASSSGGGGGGAFNECYEDYCVGGVGNQPYLYLRSPGTPAAVARGPVQMTDTARPATQVVDRSAVTGQASSFARSNPSPAPAVSSTTVVHRP